MDVETARRLGKDLVNSTMRGDMVDVAVKYGDGSIIFGPGQALEVIGNYPEVYVYVYQSDPVLLDFAKVVGVELHFADCTVQRYGDPLP